MQLSNPKLKRYGIIPLFTMVLTIFFGCELYEEQTYELTDHEMEIQARLTDTLSQTLEMVDLRIFGPAWTASRADENLNSSQRIGSSWYDDDVAVISDLYVFKKDTNIVAAFSIQSLVYNEADASFDSIQVALMYDADMDGDFTGNTLDTLIAEVLDSDRYLNFSTGFVAESDAWDIHFSGGLIVQAEDVSVMRLEGQSILTLTTVPAGRYLADGIGYDLAMNYLETDSAYILDEDSLQVLDFASSDNGFFLWDRSGLSAGEWEFHITDVMTVNIWNESRELLAPTDESISMQAVAYLTELKTSAAFDLEAETYLIQLVHHENVGDPAYKLAIVEGE